MTTGRIGPWMQTFSGIRFYPLDPRPEDVKLEDIAHALSLLCRFGGHVQTHYSVAEHSVRVAAALLHFIAGPGSGHVLTDEGIDLGLDALFHDGAEYVVGDVIWPVKQVIASLFGPVEHGVDQAIRTCFRLPLTQSRSVKRFDLILLATEKRDLLDPSADRSVDKERIAAEHWGQLGDIEPLPDVIVPWSAADAERAFLRMARSLFRARTVHDVGADSARRYTTHRPYCMACTHPLEPARSISDGEPTFRGFHPCPDHPEATVVYPTIPPELL